MILYYSLLVLTAFYEHPRLPVIFGLTLVKLIGLGALAVAFVKILGLQQPLRLFRWSESRLFTLLCVIVLVSQLFVYIEYGIVSSLIWSYTAALGLLVATLAFLDSFERIRISCDVLVLSLLLHAIVSLRQYYVYGIGRPYGLAGDPNYAALITLCLLPMVYFCFFLFPLLLRRCYLL